MNFSELQISLSDQQKEKLTKLVSLFQEWNGKMNLSSFNDERTIYVKHIVDSLLAANIEEIEKATNIIDLGTGGGFPGIPLAIIFPEKKFLLVDSVQKKISAIKDIVEKLMLDNVTTMSARIEELGQEKNMREKFDVVTERALAKYSTMLEYCLPLVKCGGTLIAYQTPEIAIDIEEKKTVLQKLGGRIKNIFQYELPENFGRRTILVIEKKEETPKEFPRKTGTPKKFPL